MKIKQLLSWSLCLVIATGAAPKASCKVLNFQEAIQFALEHSPVYDQAVRNKDIGTLTRKNTFSLLLPSLDFASSLGLQQNHPVGGSDPWSPSNLSFNLTENLYDNGQTLMQYEIAKYNEQIAELSTLRARDSLILSVVTQYYNFSLNMKQLDAKKEQLATLEKQLTLVQGQYQQGFKTRKDYLRLKAQVQRAQIDLINEKNTIETSNYELRHLLGATTGQEQGERLEFQPIEPETDIAELSLAPVKPEQIYDYRLSELQDRVTQVNIDLAKRAYYPQVNLKLSAFYSNSGFFGDVSPPDMTGTFAPLTTPAGILPGAESYGWAGLLTVSYNIWDWGIRKRNIEVAEDNKVIQDDVVRDTMLNSSKAVRETELQLKTFQDTYRLQKELLAAETYNYEILRADYRLGRVAYLDLIAGLNNLLDAKLNFYSIYFQLKTGLAQYQFYEGDLYDKIAH